MPKQLIELQQIDANIAKIHREWIQNYLAEHKDIRDLLMLDDASLADSSSFDFGLAKHPHLWPSNRIGKTPLAEGKEQSISDYLLKRISRLRLQKRLFGWFKPYPNIESFQTDYLKVCKLLKEKFLREAIDHSLQLAKAKISNVSITETNILDKFPTFSSLHQQFREDWLNAHFEVTYYSKIASTQLRNEIITLKKTIKVAKPNEKDSEPKTRLVECEEALALVKQSEILAKRYIDIYYEKEKKITRGEHYKKTFSAVSISIGLWAGIGCVAFTVGGIFNPLLLIPATILGYISYTSSFSTLNLLYKITQEAQYERSPNKKDVMDIFLDSILMPLYFFGGKIIMAASKITVAITKASNQLADKITSVFKTIANAWDGIVSNLDDVIDSKEALVGVKQMIVGYDEVKNTSTAGSWAYLKRKLFVDYKKDLQVTEQVIQAAKHDAQKIGKSTSETIKGLMGKSSSYQFSYALLSNNTIIQDKSYHQALLTFKLPDNLPKHLLKLQQLHEKYKNLRADALLCERYQTLVEINDLILNNPSLEKLKKLISLELGIITLLIDKCPNDTSPLLIQTRLKK